MQQRLASLGRAHAARPAVEQPHAPRRLHRTQPLARRGERQADFSRAVGDAARLGDGEEQAQVGWIEAHGRESERYPIGQNSSDD